MKSLNNGGDRAPTVFFLSPQIQYLVGLYLIELLAKGFSWNSQTMQSKVKTIGYSQQSDSKSPLLKVTPTQIIEHGEIEMVPKYTLQPYAVAYLFGTGRYSVHYQRRDVNTSIAINCTIYCGVLPASYASVIAEQSLWK